MKLQQAIEHGRLNDKNANQPLLDQILHNDTELNALHQQVKAISAQRMQHLQEYNRQCEEMGKKTKEVETMLKEKETQRY